MSKVHVMNSNRKTPALSIVVPVFNTEATIEKCVRSLTNQPLFEKCEIVLVNDGSIDSSQKVIDELITEYPLQVKNIFKSNKGPGDTRNAGIKASAGDYVAFVDSDDTVEPDYLEEIFRITDTFHPDMVVIDYNRIYTKKRNFFERVYKFKRIKRADGIYNVRSSPDLIAGLEVASWLRIIRRNIFENNGQLYFSTDLKVAEDMEASFKWYLYVDRIYVLNKKIYNYLIRPSSLNFRAESVLHFLKVIENICSFYKQEKRFDEFEKQLEYVCSKQLLLSNLLRLRTAKVKGAYNTFLTLLEKTRIYFPDFHKNRYLKNEPVFVRLTLLLTNKMPWLFRVVLK